MHHRVGATSTTAQAFVIERNRDNKRFKYCVNVQMVPLDMA